MALTNAQRQAKHRARYSKVAFTAWEVAALESALMAALEGCVAPRLEPISANVLLSKLASLTPSQES